jgi:tRNA(fMet)-specific endonuclease VapC
VIGELTYGAKNSNSIVEKLSQIEDFSKTVNLLNVGVETAAIYGEIKADLKKIGRPIPENDIWIAAIAKEHDLSLMTQDKHFQHISQLKLLI